MCWNPQNKNQPYHFLLWAYFECSVPLFSPSLFPCRRIVIPCGTPLTGNPPLKYNHNHLVCNHLVDQQSSHSFAAPHPPAHICPSRKAGLFCEATWPRHSSDRLAPNSPWNGDFGSKTHPWYMTLHSNQSMAGVWRHRVKNEGLLNLNHWENPWSWQIS